MQIKNGSDKKKASSYLSGQLTIESLDVGTAGINRVTSFPVYNFDKG